MKRQAHHIPVLFGLRPAAAVGVLAALTVLTAACTATSSGAPPAESGPVSAAVETVSAPSSHQSAGSTPVTGADAGGPTGGVAAIPQVVEQMLDGGDRYDNLIKAFVVQVDGQPVVERYHPDWGPESSKNVFSVTKSVMSLLIGIAIDEGSIAGVDQTLAKLLPQYVSVMAPGVGDVTLEQVLMMTGGLVSDDDPAWFTLNNPPDWAAAFLATPLARSPGTLFEYSSMGSHLLSAILTTATGRSALDFAREKVFKSLAIATEPTTAAELPTPNWGQEFVSPTGFDWRVDPQGLQFGATDLKITAPDMIKIGQLYLDHGQWKGAQIVSANWVEKSTSHLVDTGFSPLPGYGYQWRALMAGDHAAFAAVGYAGQLIEVVPDLGLVVAVASQDAPAAFDASSFVQLVQRNLVPLLERSTPLSSTLFGRHAA